MPKETWKQEKKLMMKIKSASMIHLPRVHGDVHEKNEEERCS
jgi:hypothetical protein